VSLLKAVLCRVHGQVPLAVLRGRPYGIEGDRHVFLADAKKSANRDGAQMQTLSNLPQNATTVTNYYKRNVYDPSDAKIGEISDVLVSKDGKIDAFIAADVSGRPRRAGPLGQANKLPPMQAPAAPARGLGPAI
jgi:hypothetical protein